MSENKFYITIGILALIALISILILFISNQNYRQELDYIKSGEYYEFITTENEMYEEVLQSMLDYLEQATYTDIREGFKADRWLQWLAMSDTEFFIKVYEFLKDYETKMV